MTTDLIIPAGLPKGRLIAIGTLYENGQTYTWATIGRTEAPFIGGVPTFGVDAWAAWVAC